jgi:predicted nuclease of predicted toxin-antitoxin system
LKFKLDENLSPALAGAFAVAGHEAHSILEQSLGGKSDAAVIEVCARGRRALITLDLDFANIQQYPPAQYSGIVVLRLAS